MWCLGVISNEKTAAPYVLGIFLSSLSRYVIIFMPFSLAVAESCPKLEAEWEVENSRQVMDTYFRVNSLVRFL